MRGYLVGSVGLLFASTLGAGIFSLPYIVGEAGWATSLFYLVLFSGVIMFCHLLYWRVLEATSGDEDLVGLARRFAGSGFGWFVLFAVVGGIVLALVAYLILATQFVRILLPALGSNVAFVAFWFLASLPLFFDLRRVAELDFLGTLAIAGIVVFIFLQTNDPAALFRLPAVHYKNILLPFGAILFSLAGWTAIQPMHEYAKLTGQKSKTPIFLGTAIVAVLYVLFVLGVFGSTAEIHEDLLASLKGWPIIKLNLLALLGLFALWSSYTSLSREVNRALRGVGLPVVFAVGAALFLPPLLVALGFNKFIAIIGFSGGVFLSLEYFAVILVSLRALRLRFLERAASYFLAIFFVIAAIYEIYHFVL